MAQYPTYVLCIYDRFCPAIAIVPNNIFFSSQCKILPPSPVTMRNRKDDANFVIKLDSRIKSRQDSWGATFVSDWQPPSIFVRLTWNFSYMCSTIDAHAQEVSGKSDKDSGLLSVVNRRFQTTVIHYSVGNPEKSRFLSILIFGWKILIF